MSQNTRELESLHAYLRLLEGRGASGEQLKQRRSLLMLLLPLLERQPQDGNRYRACVDQLLQRIDRMLWPAFLAAAREYYHFWTGDIKAIAALRANGGYDAAPPVRDLPQEDLRQLWLSLDQEQFGVAETWPLKAYAAALRDEGADKAVIDTRLKLAKLLLVRLREVREQDANRYRIGVDCTVPLFALKETRQLFLIVAREFYHFWSGDPDAGARIQLEAQRAET